MGVRVVDNAFEAVRALALVPGANVELVPQSLDVVDVAGTLTVCLVVTLLLLRTLRIGGRPTDWLTKPAPPTS